MKLYIEVINRQRKIKISLKRVSVTVNKIFNFLYNLQDKNLIKILNKKKYCLSLSISVIFIGNKKMKELNCKYRGKNATTDVLSFVYFENDFSGNLFLGEIFINPERVNSQAKQYNISFWHEITRVLIHGFLHIIGYDHEGNRYQTKKMQDVEEKILNYLQS
ncbi:MAG TPA: rRNA maturation RNase YbeY [Thermodesulfovibrio thiophilus]|uniref:rRNA maturation RNase YbeY n=1 Tax=Thermodesulfovibrio thiophilus TaxID=340095 RepID=UPI0017C7E711|nr:rRNA maturation RNase YbeY [Thermodesulfovibrio thiophilus]HHW20375.1 rRNA maturation RNase YbeY [Thermodesulfovibrio thiophilus]HOA82704.1 rRNA maturation RNase YbeY [Thermodesulfovibrio thiophilus]HQA03970.1 rRNA maturation RNase YbeY [Thermodesulfovibrio thiophilus]HQD35691.1 rRNA maturation RNase YbeY [Thermodesulfovibrio thiophilus]